MKSFRLPCGCEVERRRPEHLSKMCTPHLVEFTELHNRAAAEHNVRAIAGEDPRSRDRLLAQPA